MDTPINIGISTCLLGENVRYDGGHKRDRYLTDTLGQYVRYVPVCPEVEAGFGVPRESMQLRGDPDAPRLMTNKTEKDMTRAMLTWARGRVVELEKEDLSGFIFKARSPSSGMERVKVVNDQGMPVKKGVGLFARTFMDHFPLIPVEEEGRLHDPKLRESFIESVFVFKRWRTCLEEGRSRGKLVAFHTKHKLLIMSHSVEHYRSMGKLVAQVKDAPLDELYDIYQDHLMGALKRQTTIKKHVNVLQHMMGYFKKVLSTDEKEELLGYLDLYRNGYLPLIVPITLINHYVRKYDQPYLKQQYYLHPHPVELQLRNHV